MLVKSGKKLFLSTNSHEEYVGLIMTQTLGCDWQSLFALTCVNSQKPSFFRKSDLPFYNVDKS